MENNILPAAIPQEKTAPHQNGFLALLLVIVGLIATVAGMIYGAVRLENELYLSGGTIMAASILLMVISLAITSLCGRFYNPFI